MEPPLHRNSANQQQQQPMMMMGHQWSSVQRARRQELDTQQSPRHIRQGRAQRRAHVAPHHRLIGLLQHTQFTERQVLTLAVREVVSILALSRLSIIRGTSLYDQDERKAKTNVVETHHRLDE